MPVRLLFCVSFASAVVVVVVACAGDPAPAPDDSGASATASATPGSESEFVDAVLVDYTACVRAAGYPTFGPGGSPDGSIVLKDGTTWSPRDVVIGEPVTFSPAVLELQQQMDRCAGESGLTRFLAGRDREIADESRRLSRLVREVHLCMARRGWDIGPALAESSSVAGGAVTRYPRLETASAGWTDEQWSAWLNGWGSCEAELYGASGIVESPY